jgi:hypothetical protein
MRSDVSCRCKVCLDSKGFAARPCPGCGRLKEMGEDGHPITPDDAPSGTYLDRRREWLKLGAAASRKSTAPRRGPFRPEAGALAALLR